MGGGAPRVLSRQILAEIVEPRVEEIFMLVQHEIQKCGMEELLASGVVITGGSTLLAGMPPPVRTPHETCRPTTVNGPCGAAAPYSVTGSFEAIW